jgi:hypothetical protein
MKELTDLEKAVRLQQQLDFLDYIFPQISKRLADLEGEILELQKLHHAELHAERNKSKNPLLERYLNGQTRESQESIAQ